MGRKVEVEKGISVEGREVESTLGEAHDVKRNKKEERSMLMAER